MAIGNVVYTPKKPLTSSDVVDGLTSTDPDLPLSARMGGVLDRKIYFKTNNNPPYNIDDPSLPPGLYGYGHDNQEITGARPPFNYGYIVNIRADNSLLFQIAFQYFAKGLYVRNYYSQNGNYTWSEWEGMITESDPDYLALKKDVSKAVMNGFKRHDIGVGGSDQMFYPLVINIDSYGIQRVVLASYADRSNKYRKSKAEWIVCSDGWGTSLSIKKLKYYGIGSLDTSKIISKTGGLTNAGFGWFVIWVRGGCNYHITTDIIKQNYESPVVYYERTNLRPNDTTYPFYVEPTDRIEDDTYNSYVDNL